MKVRLEIIRKYCLNEDGELSSDTESDMESEESEEEEEETLLGEAIPIAATI